MGQAIKLMKQIKQTHTPNKKRGASSWILSQINYLHHSNPTHKLCWEQCEVQAINKQIYFTKSFGKNDFQKYFHSWVTHANMWIW